MTLDEAAAAVEASLDSSVLRVDRRRVREDEGAFLLLVLDTSNGRYDGQISNGPRLVDKRTGEVSRLTVPAAVKRAEQMTVVPQLTWHDGAKGFSHSVPQSGG
ncbi:MAG TPA: hypothetical protein VIT42_15785 [Microlunatus sp.]